MHILLTVNSAWNVLNFRRSLVEALFADGHKISILAPEDSAVTELERMGCRVRNLIMSPKGLNPREGLLLQRQFTRAFLEEKPDIVLSYTIKNNIFGARTARKLSVPFVPNITGLGTAFLSGRLLRSITETLYRRSLRLLPIVFFQNADDRDLFVARDIVLREQARLLPGSGVDLNVFAPCPMPRSDKPPVFLMIGRLLKDKGVIEFVEAARTVRKQHPAIRFQLLGPIGADNRSAIDKSTVQKWTDEGVVEYLGATKDVRPFIAEASCIVLPSYREGAPRSLIEAAAMARPLIATDVPGCNGVVEAGISGLLCKPGNAVSLANAMKQFVSLSPEIQATMGRAGRRKMEREFDHRFVISAYREAIEHLTGIQRNSFFTTPEEACDTNVL